MGYSTIPLSSFVTGQKNLLPIKVVVINISFMGSPLTDAWK